MRMRTLGFGKYASKQIERLMVEEAHYVMWMINHPDPRGPLAAALHYVQERIASFNARPFVTTCYGDCQKIATRYSLYRGSPEPYFWCESCDPCKRGASRGTLTVRSTYEDALQHIQANTGRKQDYEYLVVELVKAKGLTGRRTAKRLEDFFK